MRNIILGILFMGLLLSGCTFLGGGSNSTVNDTNVTPPAPVVKNPTFSITSPTPSQSFSATSSSTDVQLSISTQNLILKSPGGAAKKGEGYFKVSVDGANQAIVTTKLYTISGLSLGDHRVKVELFNNDGKSYSISKEVSFTIVQEVPVQYVPQNYVVNMVNFSYQPSTINVKVGDSITFVNTESFPRSATSFADGKEVFNTGVLATGVNATVVLNQTGTFDFYSVTHRAMSGQVIVSSNGTG